MKLEVEGRRGENCGVEQLLERGANLPLMLPLWLVGRSAAQQSSGWQDGVEDVAEEFSSKAPKVEGDAFRG